MSETKHTPGPWINIAEDESGYPVISGPDDTNIAQILCPLSTSKGKDVGELLEEVIANKNLITAAPDLLAALKAARDKLDELDGNCVDGIDTPLMLSLDAAIAKAEGAK
jgi:hypothetical protein